MVNPNLTDYTYNATKSTELMLLFLQIQRASRAVASAVGRAGLENMFGFTGSSNVQGEEQHKLDIFANDAFKQMVGCGQVAVMASEEDSDFLLVEPIHSGKYCVTFDPLDGSTNINVNVSIGSIFGIYERKSEINTLGNIFTLEDDPAQIDSNYILTLYVPLEGHNKGLVIQGELHETGYFTPSNQSTVVVQRDISISLSR